MSDALASRRRASRRWVSAVLLVSALTTASATAVRPAAADPLADAKSKASALQAQVAHLQVEAEQATEKYDATEAALGALIGEQQQAKRTLEGAQRALAQKRAVIDERVRALYISGGTFSLYANVLQGDDPGRVAIGLHDVALLSHADQQVLDGIASATESAKGAQTQVDSLVKRQTQLMAQASTAQSDVERALAQQRQALADATEQVREIEAEIQARLDAEAAARAAAAMTAARAAALAAGYVGGPASAVAQAAIEAASTQLGKPYVYGGSGPDVWDCSGLTQWAYRQAGVVLPRTAAEQYAAVAAKVPLGELEPGDLLFWATDSSNPASIHHVALYLGNGQMLAAPHTGTVVRIQPVYLDGYYGAVRPA